MKWFVYLAQGNNGHLYCGITIDPVRRIEEHNTSKRGAKWAKAHRPVVLVWTEEHETKSSALKREYQIKQMKAKDKQLLVKEKENETI